MYPLCQEGLCAGKRVENRTNKNPALRKRHSNGRGRRDIFFPLYFSVLLILLFENEHVSLI